MTTRADMSSRALGFLLVGIAAWGGVVAFVGPTFDFRIRNVMNSWIWNENHAALYFAPGLVGVVGGLLILTATRRAPARLGGLLALVSGSWFLIGPTLEPLWRSASMSASGTIGASGSTGFRALEGIGYHYGTGAVMVALSMFALGLLASAPVTAPAAVEPETTAPTVAPAPPGPRPFARRHPTHA
jgi:hypothetical protein